ncbi:ferritin-like domain-containing protein [Silvibacterium sp.]|uniref:ferritin-like domain-containing protein n=1 Tax=Silvibacterium sp. TaxID=1964179 RepID=UPI0039E448E7
MSEIDLNALQQCREERLASRRSALIMGGAALAGLALGSRAAAQTTVTDTDILNFALNLEFLEAQFYTLATTGMTLSQAGLSIDSGSGSAGGSVTVKSSPMVPFLSGDSLQSFAMEVAEDEQNHVKFLQSALGSSAVAMPNIDLLNSFNALAQAAGLGSSFDPFASETNFLIGAFIFEDVGVTAYQGAAGLISSKTYLDKAVGIHGVEAYHAAGIRTRIFQAGTAAQQISQAVAATRAKLDGTGNDDIGVSINSSGAATIVDNDSNGMTYARTTTQVLSIVYGGGAAGTGGAFYPDAMNGTIK